MSAPHSPAPTVPITPIKNLHSTSRPRVCDATSEGSDCDATVQRRAHDASASQDVRDAMALQDACEESPLDSRPPGGEASSQTQLPQITPINPTDISVLSQSTYQHVHRRTPSVHLSMTSSTSGKGASETTTPSLVLPLRHGKSQPG
jgi:hypothetical protein